jgi:hypothetical protein
LFAENEVPTQTNPLGVKGAGESGTVGALPAVMKAINDAIACIGAPYVQMPATPEKVWRAIAAAQGGARLQKQQTKLLGRSHRRAGVQQCAGNPQKGVRLLALTRRLFVIISKGCGLVAANPPGRIVIV